MAKKIAPIIKEGDEIEVDVTRKPRKGDLVLFSYNTVQWIERYQFDYKNTNCYKIIKVVI